MLEQNPGTRLIKVIKLLGIWTSSWYYQLVPKDQRRRPGPNRQPVPPHLEEAIKLTAQEFPMWGYKRIAVVCRRRGFGVTNRQAYRVMKAHGLLNKPQPRKAELYQAARLFDLLPSGPNDLWQTDVTYIHIPGHGWWYAVTVIDYFSRYLLALYLTPSFAAEEITKAMGLATAHAESIHGKLKKPPFLVTDNGTSFLSKRFRKFIAEDFQHVRIQYRTPTQLGLLERFHQNLKQEEVYWRIYENPGHCRDCLEDFHKRYNNVRPHWALKPVAGGDPVTPEDVYAKGVVVTLPKWQHWARAARKKLDKLMAEDSKPSMAA